VLDFCWVLAGPFGTRLLANFGADVIRVEDKRGYDDFLPEGHRDRHLGAFHNAVNTHKRSITIDPTTTRGRELLLDLVEHADIVTNNYRPGAFEEMGFGFDVLRARNPRVISLHMPGCGRNGPWRDRGSFGNMVAAACGISWLTGFPGRSPRGLGVAYPDFTGPYLLAMTAVAALGRRERTGVGSEVEVNQLTGAVALIGVDWLDYVTSGFVPPMRANRDPNWCPHGIYPAEGNDEWVAVAVGSDGEWERLCDVLGIDASSYPTHAARKAAEDDVDALVAAWTATRPKWSIAETLQAIGVAAAPVEHLADSMTRDPYLSRWVEMVRQPTHPSIEIPIAGEAIQVAGARRRLAPAHVVGADTDDVLRELLGLDAGTIASLRDEGVVW
jgi:crotonobetainyl-CoA:carnitine CoA-transferase CaiB-like acyl-CoA transferase